MIDNPNPNSLRTASLSFDVALIPASPLKNAIAQASMAIAEEFTSRNVIDNTRFPAHLSMYIGGTTPFLVESFWRAISETTNVFSSVEIVADALRIDDGGFISVTCQKTDALMSVMNSMAESCGRVHRIDPYYRPRILSRWSRLTDAEKVSLTHFGDIVAQRQATPHFSVADVDALVAQRACAITQPFLRLPQVFHIESVQLVDVGHNNQQWTVLHSWER